MVMINKIEKLHDWLFDKGFVSESGFIADLAKHAAGNPLPINRAEVDEIVDLLLEKLGAKFLVGINIGGGGNLHPFDLYHVLAGEVGLDDAVTRDRAGRPSLLIDHLESEVVIRAKQNIGGQIGEVKYKLMFSDSPHKPPGATGLDPDTGNQTVVLGWNPNSALVSEIQSYLRSNNSEYARAAGNMPAEIRFFSKSIRNYLIEILRHEEVHVRDVIPLDPRHQEKYTVSDPDGETLIYISNRLGVDPYMMLLINMDNIIEKLNVQISSGRVDAVKRQLEAGFMVAAVPIFQFVKDRKLNKDVELSVPLRAQSNTAPNPGDTLQSIADRTGVKGGALRLLIINFNDIFASRLTLGDGEPIGRAPSYQAIYDRVPDHAKETMINTPIPSGEMVTFIPSFAELYRYDRGFYLITREESKAHFEQIIRQLELATENMNPEEIRALSLNDMIEMSEIAKEYRDSIKVNTVDHLIKTPIGFLDRLKETRSKDFGQRMYEHWMKNKEKEKRKFSDPEQIN
ncbi:hypothetical protein CMI41_04775 [Candidatus Pacearchaeota archaeon]|nr:hypothetical protein [Candidatus Pacearchaeota archaeon]